jgi:hypothetical protein
MIAWYWLIAAFVIGILSGWGLEAFAIMFIK